MVQSRYLGSDEAIAQQDAAINQANQSNLQAVDAIGKATGGYINSVVEGQNNLSKLDLERQAAQAKSQAGWKGLGDAVQQGVSAYGNYQSQKEANALKKANVESQIQARTDAENARQQEFDLRKEALGQKQAAQAAKEADERDYVGAVNDLGLLEGKAAETNWQDGVPQYRAEAAQILAKYPGLSKENLAKLMDRVNGKANERFSTVTGKLQADAEKARNYETQREQDRISIGLQGVIQKIKLGSPTDQSSPAIQEADEFLQKNVVENSALTDLQKGQILTYFTGQIAEAHGTKTANYIKNAQQRDDYNTWSRRIAEVRAKLQQGGDPEEFDRAIEQLKIETPGNDFTNAFKKPGQREKEAADLVQSAGILNRSVEDAQKKTVINFEYSPDSVRGMAAGIIVNKNLLLELTQNPNTRDSLGVKTAIALAGRINDARKEQGKLGIDRAKSAEQIASLNLRNAKDISETTLRLNKKIQANQPLSATEQLSRITLVKYAETNPQIATNLQQQANINPQLTPAQQAEEKKKLNDELQKYINTNNTAYEDVKQKANATYNATRAKFDTDYADLIKQFGKIPSDQDLAIYYKNAQPSLDKDRQKFIQQLEQSTTNALPGFGATGNFNKVGGNLAASDSPNGRGYVVAPRSRLHVQTKNPDGGVPFITPLMTGVNANNSMNRGNTGGGYKAGRSGGRQHAGADFPVNVGQQTATVVSGTVVKIGNDPSGYGNYIDFRGDNGFIYRYAHQRSFVKVGQRLNAGDAVSTSNGSGAGGPHLHFEVRTAQSYASSSFGISGTIDPIAHLRDLTKLAGTTVGTAGNMRNASQSVVVGSLPWMKTDRNTLFTPQGGALQAGLFQQIGKPVQSASTTFTNQRPFSKGGGVGYVAGTPSYNHNDDLGYAYLRERPELRIAITKAAQTLGVPAAWIADIAAQETGNFRMAEQVHPGSPNRNYGLFGFGSDSGVKNWTRLNPVQQVEAYTSYMMREGWQKAKGANGTLAQFWAVTRGGVAWRNRLLRGDSPESLKTENGMSFADELRLLGNHVGREYAVPGGMRSERARRNRAVRKSSTNNTSQGLAFNNSSEAISRG